MLLDSVVGAWSEAEAGTDSGATATHAAETDRQHFVTRISGHTDIDALLQIKDGDTVIWETYIDVSVNPAFMFDVSPLPVTPGTACSGVLAASTADCYVTLQGFSMP